MIKLQVDFSFVKNYLRKKKNVELLKKDNDEELFIEVSFFYQVVTATFMLVRLWFYQGIYAIIAFLTMTHIWFSMITVVKKNNDIFKYFIVCFFI